jgi:predicted RNA methylase
VKAAAWVPLGTRIIEPSCGSGNLIDALLRLGHAPENITGVEIDERWCTYCDERFDRRVRILCEDFRARTWAGESFDVALMNPPFEDEAHTAFVLDALEIAQTVVAIVPASFEFGTGRDRELWSKRGVISRRAVMPRRPKFGGAGTGLGDMVCLQIDRRKAPREPGEVLYPATEVWYDDSTQ